MKAKQSYRNSINKKMAPVFYKTKYVHADNNALTSGIIIDLFIINHSGLNNTPVNSHHSYALNISVDHLDSDMYKEYINIISKKNQLTSCTFQHSMHLEHILVHLDVKLHPDALEYMDT